MAVDYKKIGVIECTYPIPYPISEGNLDGEKNCGEPAKYEVWWDDDYGQRMFVCQKHLDEILNVEKAGDTNDNA